MHPAVELLVKRMESNPDEFAKNNPRSRVWDKLITDYESYMTEEEKGKVRHAYSEIQMEQLHKQIMAELLKAEQKTEDPFNIEQFRLPKGYTHAKK
jgi:hypothetical protein